MPLYLAFSNSWIEGKGLLSRGLQFYPLVSEKMEAKEIGAFGSRHTKTITIML